MHHLAPECIFTSAWRSAESVLHQTLTRSHCRAIHPLLQMFVEGMFPLWDIWIKQMKFEKWTLNVFWIWVVDLWSHFSKAKTLNQISNQHISSEGCLTEVYLCKFSTKDVWGVFCSVGWISQAIWRSHWGWLFYYFFSMYRRNYEVERWAILSGQRSWMSLYSKMKASKRYHAGIGTPAQKPCWY